MQVEAKTFVLIQSVGATAGANRASGATGYLRQKEVTHGSAGPGQHRRRCKCGG
jgi:hypothetical protein